MTYNYNFIICNNAINVNDHFRNEFECLICIDNTFKYTPFVNKNDLHDDRNVINLHSRVPRQRFLSVTTCEIDCWIFSSNMEIIITNTSNATDIAAVIKAVQNRCGRNVAVSFILYLI